jgi:Kef-type K+ transport system membrane component KefB
MPFALGWAVGALLLPDASVYVHAFLGATLTATSVGITARVLSDLGKTDTREARIILGAAVIDDVMGLVILAVVSGAIAAAAGGQGFSYRSLVVIVARALLFLVGALVIGARVAPVMIRLASRLQARGVLLAIALAWCFLVSWLAGVIGLAPIVGAFAAGLVLEKVRYRDRSGPGEHELEELVAPIAAFLVPVFFVVMGMRTDLASFADRSVLGLAAALTAAAVVGKQVCGLAVIGDGIDRLTVGLGMIPRGEVGLIFANMGMALTLGGAAIVTPPLYSAIVVMVIVTTLITPPALEWSLGRSATRTPR